MSVETPSEKPSTENPYVGLRPFRAEDSLFFFGRRQQTAELLELLRRTHFLAVVGSSGCGKSSLVRAGLEPALLAGFLVEERDRWRIAEMKPGHSPLRNLAVAICGSNGGRAPEAEVDALMGAIVRDHTEAVIDYLIPRLADSANLLLLLDQFEEIFTFRGTEDEERLAETHREKRLELARRRTEAADFVDLFLRLAERADLPIYIVLTMRTDFLGDCDLFYGLPEAMNRSRYLVPRLTREQLREAIEGPALLSGAEIAPGLTDRLRDELGDRADRLPVLQHALLRTWEVWARGTRDGQIDVSHYQRSGTLEEALSRHAKEALAECEPLAAERIFKRLTDTDPALRRVRRPASVSELMAVTGLDQGSVEAILARFSEGGRNFLVLSEGAEPGDPRVEISHESLIRQWGRLRGWVDDERKSRDRLLELVDRARGKELGERGLLRNPELQLALDWWQEEGPTSDWAARYCSEDDFMAAEGYLQRSRAAAEAAELRRKRNRYGLIAATVVVILLLAALWMRAKRAAEDAAKQARVAQAQTRKAEEQTRVAEVQAQLAEAARKRTEEASLELSLQKEIAERAAREALKQKKEAEAQRLSAEKKAIEVAVAKIVGRFERYAGLGESGKSALWQLAGEDRAVRRQVLGELLSSPENADRFNAQSGQILHALLGLDPAARMPPVREAVASHCLNRTTHTTNSTILSACAVLVRELPESSTESPHLAMSLRLVEAMRDRREPWGVSRLAPALADLGGRLDSAGARALGQRMIETILAEGESGLDLIEALMLLAERLDDAAASSFGRVLVNEALTGLEDRELLAVLAEVFPAWSDRLSAEDSRRAGELLSEALSHETARFLKETDGLARGGEDRPACFRCIEALSRALSTLEEQLGAEQARPLCSLLLRAMERASLPDSWRNQLAAALARLSEHLSSGQAEAASRALLTAIDGVTDNEEYLPLARAVLDLRDHLDPVQTEAAGRALLTAIDRVTANEEYLLLAGVVLDFRDHLDPVQLRGAGHLLLAGLSSEMEAEQFDALARTVVELLEPLDSGAVRDLGKRFLEAMANTDNSERLAALAADFRGWGERLDTDSAQALSEVLLEAMQRQGRTDNLVGLARVLAGVWKNLDAERARAAGADFLQAIDTGEERGWAIVASFADIGPLETPAAAAVGRVLIASMKRVEKEDWRFPALVQAVAPLADGLEAEQTREIAELLLDAFESGSLQAEMTMALADLGHSLGAAEARAAAARLFNAMDKSESGRRSDVALVLAGLSVHLNAEQARAAVTALTEAVTTETWRHTELAIALAALADHLDADQAPATAILVMEAMGQEWDRTRLARLTDGLTDLWRHLDAEQKSEVSPQFVEALKRNNRLLKEDLTPVFQLLKAREARELGALLVEVMRKEPWRRVELAAVLADLHGLEAEQLLATRELLAESLEDEFRPPEPKLAENLSALAPSPEARISTLVEVLGRPTLPPAAQEAVIAILARLSGADPSTFDLDPDEDFVLDRWRFAAWAASQGLDLPASATPSQD